VLFHDTQHVDPVIEIQSWHLTCEALSLEDDMTKRDLDHNDLESPLGLANEPITRTAEDHIENSGDESSRRRRARALGEDGIDRNSSGSTQDEHDGATGIDMGYGGDGTNIRSGS
jgi:hypothetical protein